MLEISPNPAHPSHHEQDTLWEKDGQQRWIILHLVRMPSLAHQNIKVISLFRSKVFDPACPQNHLDSHWGYSTAQTFRAFLVVTD